MIKFLALFLFASLSSVFSWAGSPDFQTEIYNGRETPADSPIARSTVFIYVKLLRTHATCSGSLIAPDLVLTAAHCLGAVGDARLTVYFGTRGDPKGGPGGTRVINQLFPENAMLPGQAHGWNDIALLKLEKPAPEGYSPIAILDGTETFEAGTAVTLAGYGAHVQKPKDYDDVGTLRDVEQEILDPRYDEKSLLVSIRGKGACFGDSGGPALIERDGILYLLGVASRLTAHDLISKPGKPAEYACIEDMVYTDLRSQRAWLKQAMVDIYQ